MTEKDQYPNNVVENKMKIFNNVEQSAVSYVQEAIENSDHSTPDATQKLVNEDMKIQNGKTQGKS